MSARKGSVLLALLLSACAAVTAERPAPHAAARMPDRTLALDGEQQFAQACKDFDEWDKPAPPFRILGGTWYVGTCGISAILIADPAGHILIDSGTEAGAAHILANIRRIGADPGDIRYLLTSHEHFDHAGGHAAIVRATGASVVSSAQAAQALLGGRPLPGDPQADAGHPAMTPVATSRIVGDGEEVSITVDPSTSQNRLVAHATPGHTPGALSWTWIACALPGEPPVCRRIAYADSLSPVSADGYRFTDHPDLVATFRRSFDTVEALPCDILLTPHPSSSRMIERVRLGNLWEPGQCRAYARNLRERLDQRLASERAGG